MSDDFGGYEIKELRERLVDADINALADAGLIDEEVLNYLITFEKAYEPNTGAHYEDGGETAYWAENTELWHDIVRRQVSKNLRKAVRSGKRSIIQFALGFGDNEDKVRMDFVQFYRLKEILETPAFMLNLFASPRTGKTYTGARLCDLWLMFHPQGQVVSNIKSWAEKHDRAVYEDDMPRAIIATRDHPGPSLLFMDELSSEGSWSEIQKSGVESGIRSYFRKFGKDPYAASYIGIGHRVVEIAPVLRSGELAYFGFKEGRTKDEAQKRLVIYEDEDKDEKVCDLDGIGLPEVSPDTHDPAEWDWGSPEDFIELGFMKPDDDEGEEAVEAFNVCQGVKMDGEPCPSAEWNDTGYCYNHQAQAEAE